MKWGMQSKKTAKNLVFLLTTSPLFLSAPAHAELKWSTYIGGSKEDSITAIAMHSTGDIILTGVTFSADFPATAGAYDTTLAPGGNLVATSIFTNLNLSAPALTTQDVFVTRLSADGKTIKFSTLLGGSWNEVPNDVVVDTITQGGGSSSGGTSVSGPGGISGGSASGPGSTTSGKGEPGGKNPKSPGDGSESIERITIAGRTNSRNFPITPGAIDAVYEIYNYNIYSWADSFSWTAPEGFISSFDANLGTLVYSTFLGGDRNDSVQALAVAPNHDIIAVGLTSSLGKNSPITAKTFVTENYPCYDENVCTRGFIARLSASGQLKYQSLVGGAVNDVAMIGDDAVIVGTTYTDYFYSKSPIPLKGAFGQTFSGLIGLDGFVMRLTPMDSVPPYNQLKFSSYINGKPFDDALSIVVAKDGSKDLIIAGVVKHDINDQPTNPNPLSHLMTPGAFDTTANGDGGDGFTNDFMGMRWMYTYQDWGALPNVYTLAESVMENSYLTGDIYILRMTSDGQSANPIVYATYLGGGGTGGRGADSILPGRGLTIDEQGRVIVAGYTESYNFPVTPGAIDATPIKPVVGDISPALYNLAFLKHVLPFVSVLDMKKQGYKDLVYSTFLGNGYGYAADVDVTSNGNIIVAGRTEDAQFPVTAGVVKPVLTGLNDGFVTVLDTKLLPQGKYGMYSDNTSNYNSAPVFENPTVYGPYKVDLDIGDTQPFFGNVNFKLKLSNAQGLEGKNVTLYIAPAPLLPGQKNTLGKTYTFVDLTSAPTKVLKIDATINNNGSVNFKIPLLPGALTVGAKGVPFYAQAFIAKNADQKKYVASNAIMVTPQ